MLEKLTGELCMLSRCSGVECNGSPNEHSVTSAGVCWDDRVAAGQFKQPGRLVYQFANCAFYDEPCIRLTTDTQNGSNRIFLQSLSEVLRKRNLVSQITPADCLRPHGQFTFSEFRCPSVLHGYNAARCWNYASGTYTGNKCTQRHFPNAECRPWNSTRIRKLPAILLAFTSRTPE